MMMMIVEGYAVVMITCNSDKQTVFVWNKIINCIILNDYHVIKWYLSVRLLVTSILIMIL